MLLILSKLCVMLVPMSHNSSQAIFQKQRLVPHADESVTTQRENDGVCALLDLWFVRLQTDRATFVVT
jgi:hypothetical protein